MDRNLQIVSEKSTTIAMNSKVSSIQNAIFKPIFTSVLLISCLIVNVIQIVLHIFVKPVSKRVFYVVLDVVSNSAFCSEYQVLHDDMSSITF